jgi:hypothetical protein
VAHQEVLAVEEMDVARGQAQPRFLIATPKDDGVPPHPALPTASADQPDSLANLVRTEYKGDDYPRELSVLKRIRES